MIHPRILPATGALVWLSIAAAGISAQDDGRLPAPIAVDVMTFNIRSSAIPDGGDSWEFRKEIVAEAIRTSHPLVVGMQEALADQIDFLEHALPGYRWIGVDRGLNGGTGLSEATPIFYRYDTVVPIESGTFWLGNQPAAAFRGRGGGRGGSRIVTWAHFHHIESSQRFYVFNTHFSPREGPQQLDAVARINARVAELPPGSRVLVIGDFNSAAGTSDTWKLATSEGLRDAWALAGERRGPAHTFGGFRPPDDSDELGRIDWILVGGSVEVPFMETVTHNTAGHFPSDHYPVLATVIFGPS